MCQVFVFFGSGFGFELFLAPFEGFFAEDFPALEDFAFACLSLEGFAFFGFTISFFGLPPTTEATRVCFLCDAGVEMLTPLATTVAEGLEVEAGRR